MLGTNNGGGIINNTSSKGGSGGASFLDSSKNMNDPAVLRKIIAELELEN